MPFSEPSFKASDVEAIDPHETEAEAKRSEYPSLREKRLEALKEYFTPEGEVNEKFVALCSKIFTPIARRIIGRKDQNSVEDVVQEATFKAARYLKSFNGEAALESWLFRIGYNESANFWRTMMHRKDFSQGDPLDEILENNESLSTPADQEKKLVTEDLLDAILTCLDERQRHIVELFYIDGRSLKEISIMMDENANTIKSWLYKARQKMLEYARKKGLATHA